MIILGFGQGASPLISFTYGAKEHALAARLRTITIRMVIIVGAVTFLLTVMGSGWYSNIFVKNEAVENMVQSGVIIFSISFLFFGINVIASFYFTSIGKAVESAVISSARGLVILLICIFTLPAIWGMKGVWLVAPVTEAITMLISIGLIKKERLV